MGNHKSGAAAHQVAQTFLDEGFGFGVEAGSGFVQDENARIGENGARDGDALLLSAGKFDATLADNGVVFVFKGFGKFIDARNAAGSEDFGFGGLGAGKSDILTNGSVE